LAKPEEFKKQILSMKYTDITRTFLKDNFCKLYDKETKKVKNPKYNFNDKVVLEVNELRNKEKLTTTLGRLVFNKFIVADGLEKIFGYINKPIDKKQLKNFEEEISNALLDGRISSEEISRYYDRIQWLSLTMHSVFCGSFTEKTVAPDPSIIKYKDELFKKYADDLKGKDALAAGAKIEKELMTKAKELLKGDPGLDLYDSGARGSYNNFRDMFVMRGLVWNNVTKKFDMLKNSLGEGIRKDEITSYGSQVISGAYPKAVGTTDAGYYSKKLFAVYQGEVLDEPGSDCGSKMTRTFFLTPGNYKKVKYRWIVDNGKLVCLTPDIAPKYFNKEIHMRSPLFCCGEKLCSKCAGDLFYRLKIKNIGLTTPDISSSYLRKLMKAFHDASVATTEITPDNMFL